MRKEVIQYATAALVVVAPAAPAFAVKDGENVRKGDPHANSAVLVETRRQDRSVGICAGSFYSREEVLTAGHCLHEKASGGVDFSSVLQGRLVGIEPLVPVKSVRMYVPCADEWLTVKDYITGHKVGLDAAFLRIDGVMPSCGVVPGHDLRLPTEIIKDGRPVTYYGWGGESRAGWLWQLAQRYFGSAVTGPHGTMLTKITVQALVLSQPNPEEIVISLPSGSSKGSACLGDSGGSAMMGERNFGIIARTKTDFPGAPCGSTAYVVPMSVIVNFRSNRFLPKAGPPSDPR